MSYDYEANKDKLVQNGRMLTVALFEEFQRDNVDVTPIFKLADWRKVYVAAGDPTGYKAAMELIGSWDHWMALCKSPLFAAELAKWEAELDEKIRSEAIKEMVATSKTREGTTAAKWLAEGRYKQKKRALKNTEEESTSVRNLKQDAERLGIKAIK